MHPKTILIVTIDRSVLPLWTAYLSASGYRILIAVDPAEGAELADAHRPNLILTVHPLRMRSGTFLEHLKSETGLRRMPVCTVLSDEETDPGGAEADGADCVMRFGASGPEIIEQVDALIGPAVEG